MISPSPGGPDPDDGATEPLPFRDGAEHLRIELLRVSLLVSRHRFVHTGRDDEPGDLGPGKLDRLDEEIAALDDEIARRVAASRRGTLPLAELGRRFALSRAALELLVAAAAPGLDLELGRAMAAALAERGEQPDAGFLVELLARGPAQANALLDELGESAPLVRGRLLRLGAARGWVPEGPLVRRPVAVPDRILALLRGRIELQPGRFHGAASLRLQAWDEVVPQRLRAPLDRGLFAERDGRRVPLVVSGAALAGKATAVTATAAARGVASLEVDLEVVAAAADPVELVCDLHREARLLDAVLLLRHGEVLGAARPELGRAVLAALASGTVWAALTTREALPDLVRRLGAHEVRVELPPEDEQRALWERALPPDLRLAPGLAPADIVRRYRLTPGDILEAGAGAAAAALLRAPDEPLTQDDLVAAIRTRLRHRLGDVAELVTTTLGWSDLVLRDDALDRVGELISTVRHQSTVMQEWGFGQKLVYGRAVTALFSGPPGTGKTMVATLIARELGLELFRVDLSRVVSKWVGETEKNLGRAFAEAESSQAILLFDEADALFAKRTEVKSSNDRYANLEVNYLLQRLESYEGIVLLTTNNQSSIDDAFRRRLRFRIDFPTPDADERERLWQTFLPPSAPVAPDIDFQLLAERFEMTGGYIKNAVVRAAFLAAAAAARTIDHDLLLHAATLEWEDMGKLSQR